MWSSDAVPGVGDYSIPFHFLYTTRLPDSATYTVTLDS